MDPVPKGERVIGLFGTHEKISTEWEKDFDDVITGVAQKNPRWAEELQSWKGEALTVISFFNSVFKVSQLQARFRSLSQ